MKTSDEMAKNSEEPQSLQELEERSHPRKKLTRFRLASLVVGTNLLGLLVAVIVWTKGAVFALLFVASFFLPLLVALALFLIHMIEHRTGKNVGAKEYVPRVKPKHDHPLD